MLVRKCVGTHGSFLANGTFDANLEVHFFIRLLSLFHGLFEFPLFNLGFRAAFLFCSFNLRRRFLFCLLIFTVKLLYVWLVQQLLKLTLIVLLTIILVRRVVKFYSLCVKVHQVVYVLHCYIIYSLLDLHF